MEETPERGPEAGASKVDLDELRLPVLKGLAAALLLVSWLWAAISATRDGLQPRAESLMPPLLLFLVAGLTIGISSLSLRPRACMLLLGTTLALALAYSWSGQVVWLYYQPLVITMAALLSGPSAGFALAVAISLEAFAVARLEPTGAAALGLVWATALMSWLSWRNLYQVLQWAVDSQARAWRTANEVRRRREQLRHTVDSLRTAHIALGRTARDLDAARYEAEEARRVKSRFVANISHELRTPLNIIIGFAEILCFAPETYGSVEWPTTLRDDLMTIWRNAEHLLRMVDDVLDLAQIEASRLPVAPELTDVRQLVRDTLVSCSGLLRESGLELRVSLPARIPLLNLDRTRIRQVLLNLMNNAIRFTDRGFVEVGVSLEEARAVICVRDSGEGIPSDKIEAVFQEFEQADTSLRRRHQGAGLGLAISRHFVRLHGGRMWAESEVGQGSSFYFSLPLPQTQAAVQPVQPRREGRRLSPTQEQRGLALILCSDPLAVRVLERHLEGMDVLGVESASAAIAALRERRPDVLFLVRNTPESLAQAGDEARNLMREAAPAQVPVLVAGFPTERRAGARLGVPELLLKPVTQKEVVGAVRRLCERPRRVLIADDDPDMVALLTRMIHREWQQAEVLPATSGEEALALLPCRPSIILLDLLMSGTGGLGFLATLRNSSQAGTPVVVITARGPEQEEEREKLAEVRILRSGGSSASELMRLLTLVSGGLPASYAGPPIEPAGSPPAASI